MKKDSDILLYENKIVGWNNACERKMNGEIEFISLINLHSEKPLKSNLSKISYLFTLLCKLVLHILHKTISTKTPKVLI